MIPIYRKPLELFRLLQFCVTSDNMANRWLLLVLGVTLLQGSLSLSPIPVAEDEWEEFSRMMRDPAYRLPTTTVPRHYEVSLTPYFEVTTGNIEPFTFDGSVVIYLSAAVANTNEIVMHCNDLTIQSLTVEYLGANNVATFITAPNQAFQCEMPYSFLRIQTTEDLVLNREYIVRATFRGNIQDNMRGFYRSWYNDSVGRRWMGTTQFQPHHARQAFPCYDEPGFKATFDITIVREADFSPTISNMPIRDTLNLTSGRVSEIFYTTPVTSTYLLAFIVSHYETVATNNDLQRPFDIYARDNIGSNGDWSLEIGELLLAAMEEYTDYPYYSVAANMDMKQAAIPDFSAGAMENWGLLTYREALILYDPINSNHFYRQRVANIVSHEIAHMWFGNLVTCEWWDVLWLNEGFARFYQYYLTGQVAPELGFATRFITEQLHVSMLTDALDTAHPLTDPSVIDPAAVSAHFSTITYAKGAAILRMTQHMLGEETYVKGLRTYLKEREFNVAAPADLFSALDAAANEDNSLAAYNGISVTNYFRTWSEQAGHPMLTAVIDQQTGQMTITQARFNRNTGVSSIASLYHIPITWTRQGAPDFTDTKPVAVLTGQTSVLQRGTTGLEWVIFNKQHTGFYRVNYDPTNWALITQALRGPERTVIHEYNRANIVDDAFVFARGEVLPYYRALNILSFLEFEDAYAPWDAAITGFTFIVRRLAHDAENLQKLQNEIISLSAAVVAKLGFAEREGESYMDGLQRMYVMQFLCNNGHPGCVSAAIQNFQSWRNGGFVPANMRPWVFCTGLRNGNAADFDYYWNSYLANDLANDQVVMLQTAGCTSDEASLEKYLDAMVAADDSIRPQDHVTALNSAVSGNEINTLRTFEWLKRNIAQTTAVFGSVGTHLSYISSRLLTIPDIQAFEAWVTENRAVIGESAYNTGMNGAAGARSNLQWSDNRVAELVQYLDTGYVEDVIDIDEIESGGEETETVTDPPIVEPDTDGETDSANIAALSIITLIATITVNFLA